MNKDTIIKVLLAIIALMVFAWLWRTISGMLIGTLVLTTSLLPPVGVWSVSQYQCGGLTSQSPYVSSPW